MFALLSFLSKLFGSSLSVMGVSDAHMSSLPQSPRTQHIAAQTQDTGNSRLGGYPREHAVFRGGIQGQKTSSAASSWTVRPEQLTPLLTACASHRKWQDICLPFKR